MIDADIGLKNLDLVLGLENRIVYTILDIVIGGKKPTEAVVKHKNVKRLHLLASSQIANKDMISPEDMKQIVEELSKHFHYIIIDSPAGIERGFQNAVAPAEEILIVTTPELTAISDADRVIGLLENMHFKEDQMHLIINRVKADMVKKNEMLSPDDVKEALAIDVVGIIPDSQDVIISTNKGIPLVLEKDMPVAKSFKNIADRMTGKMIDIEEDIKILRSLNGRGFFRKLRRLFGGR